MAKKQNTCENPNSGFCVNKTMGGYGLMYKNVPKTSLFPRSGFWWRPRKIVCCIEPWHAPETRRIVFNPNIGYDDPLEGVLG